MPEPDAAAPSGQSPRREHPELLAPRPAPDRADLAIGATGRDGLAPALAEPSPARNGLMQELLAPIPAAGATLGPVWDALAKSAAGYAVRARGEGTRRTYRSAWAHFEKWCRELGREPLSGDPELISMYVVRRADDQLTVPSIRVALAAIRTAYLLAGVTLTSPIPGFA